MMKEIFHNFRFYPQYYPRYLKRQNQFPRPFFGHPPHQKIGGPAVRLDRMRMHFGNFAFDPNIIYVSSSWNPILFKAAIRSKKKGIKLVFNQNGWYYPGWYKGDWEKANGFIKKCQQESDYVIFQSSYCINAQKELLNWMPAKYEVIHNCVPWPAVEKLEKLPEGNAICWLSGVFNSRSNHVLEPLFEAFQILYSQFGKDCPRLKIAGDFDEGAKNSPWYFEIEKMRLDLISKGILNWNGSFLPNDLPLLLKDVSLGIHLTYKDACPNSILERMSFGIPHVFSDSGGTPELVGDAGLPLKVGNSWNEKLKVNSVELAKGILDILGKREEYRQKALTRVKTKFNWDIYTKKHLEIFELLLG